MFEFLEDRKVGEVFGASGDSRAFRVMEIDLGEEKFKFLIPSYAQGCSGGIFIFDLTNYESLINVINWLPEFRKVSKNFPILMVGSKLDLKEERVCNKEEALDLMELHKLHNYLECSSKTGDNVQTIFSLLLKEILNHKGYNNFKLN